VPGPALAWPGHSLPYRGRATPLHVLAFWGEGHAEAWLVLTDLEPRDSDASWYGLRSWIEQFFKDGKRGGWQWQHTRRTDPQRAERLWLAIAVATLWLLRVGGDDEVQEGSPKPTWPAELPSERPRGRRWRLVSVFARGWVVILVALLRQQRVPPGHLLPQPWPVIPDLPDVVEEPSEKRQVA
jgi:hypothetical protein